jgi:pimeloyl-ACP methyl ester carboxylesterase
MRTKLAIPGLAALLLLPLSLAHGAGVTIITHGFNGSVDDWITAMAQQIPAYDLFPGSGFSIYQITVAADYSVSQSRVGGVSPLVSDSGEIIIQLDWSARADDPFNASQDIANAVVPALLSTTFIPELGGRSLAEFPIHLIGHSRGGSVMTEMARLLGQEGVWVDHQTTLDPAPVSQYGDADVQTFVNVLFADNYWQMNSDSFCPNGQSVFGAYNRFLAALPNGYDCDHSDVHLWYHGTIDWSHTPTTDSEAVITSTERATWWTSYEMQGHVAGFLYSLIAGGNRLSTNEPAGAGNGRIRDGYNQIWDFGAGTSANRFALASNNGSWPNIIKFDLLTAQPVIQGDTVSFRYFFQLVQSAAQTATVQVFLDDDANPYDGNQGQVFQSTEQGTGMNVLQRQVSFNTSSASPGQYYVYAKISYGGRKRFLHAPGRLIIRPPPVLGIVRAGDQVVITWPTNAAGFTLESTADLLSSNSWSPVSPDPVVINGQNTVSNTIGSGNQFYRLKK